MKIYKWPTDGPNLPFVSPSTSLHQWQIRSAIPADAAQWPEWLTTTCPQWTLDEVQTALRGSYPDKDKLATIAAGISQDATIFVDIESWAPFPPSLPVGSRSPDNAADVRRAAWMLCAEQLRIATGFYGSPVHEAWCGVANSMIAEDVSAATRATRLSRWRGVQDGLVDVGFHQHVTAWCPSLYPRQPNIRRWIASTELIVAECQRRYAAASLDVIPFIAFQKLGKDEPVCLTYWTEMLRWLAANVSAVVVYASPGAEWPVRYIEALEHVAG